MCKNDLEIVFVLETTESFRVTDTGKGLAPIKLTNKNRE